MEATEEILGALIDPNVSGETESSEEETEELVEEEYSEETESSENDSEDFENTDSDEEDFEYEDEYDEIDNAGQEEPDVYTVSVDGVEQQVTLDDLKQGYSGQKYIQQKMSENAAVKKQLQEARETISAEREKIAKFYENLREGVPTPPVPPSKEVFDEDPIGFMEQKLQYEEDMKGYESKMRELEQMATAQQEEQKKAFARHVQEESLKLQQIVPDFADREKATKIMSNLAVGGEKAYGFSQSDVMGITDHRAILVLRDALAYRKIQAGKKKAQKKVKNSRPVVKPGTKRSEKQGGRKARQNKRSQLRQSGNINDAVDLIFNE